MYLYCMYRLCRCISIHEYITSSPPTVPELGLMSSHFDFKKDRHEHLFSSLQFPPPCQAQTMSQWRRARMSCCGARYGPIPRWRWPGSGMTCRWTWWPTDTPSTRTAGRPSSPSPTSRGSSTSAGTAVWPAPLSSGRGPRRSSSWWKVREKPEPGWDAQTDIVLFVL